MRLVFSIVAAAVLLTPLSACRRDEPTDDFVRRMNVGVGYIENRSSADAIRVLGEAVDMRPKSPPALRNLARAHLLARTPEHDQAALDVLQRADALKPDATSTIYLLGITLTRLSRYDDALVRLARSVQLDPENATLRFQLANIYQAMEQHDKAAEQLRATVRLDPFHTSAHYKLAGVARRNRDMEGFQRYQREFLRLRELFGDDTRSTAALENCKYTLAERATIEVESANRVALMVPIIFTDVTNDVFRSVADRDVATIGVIDVDEQNGVTLFVAGSGGEWSLMSMSGGGSFDRVGVDSSPQGRVAAPLGCAIGEYFVEIDPKTKLAPKTHARNDVLLIGASGAQLLKRTGETTFEDVTAAAGLGELRGRGARWMDYDHDGDLDLLIVSDTGLTLWQNNGNGEFQDVTNDVGITETGPTLDVAAVDLDGNIAIDIIVARGSDPTWVFENQRVGRFAAMTEPPGPWPAATDISVNDVNNDGRSDVVLTGGEGVTLLLGGEGGRKRFESAGVRLTGTKLVDIDNDGWLDLLAYGEDGTKGRGVVRIWRNLGGGDWKDVSSAVGIDGFAMGHIRDVVAADFDGDGDTDLLVYGAKMHLLRNDGGHANRQLKLRLVTIKTNPTGLGTHLEVRDGGFRIARVVSELPIEIGVGRREAVDVVRAVWTNGVVQNLFDHRTTRKPLTIIEKVVATGSCPFLLAWDGGGWRFVTDILGNAPVGLSLRRDVLLPADTDELVHVGNTSEFKPRDGDYLLDVTDAFREVLYLDSAALWVVDHAPEVEIHATDKIMPPPFPRSELWALGNQMSPSSAIGDDGIDRTEAIGSIDGMFAPPGAPLSSTLRGMCHPMTLTMDFGILDVRKPLVLALTGWLQYGDASTNIAMSQNRSLTIVPPRLEVETATDSWTPVDVAVGMPAGKTKTILCDLTGKLPPGSRRLRLSTTFEIRWDRIALLERLPLPVSRIVKTWPRSADLSWRGFPDIRTRAPGHPTTPDYDALSDRPPWQPMLTGWCTRYGDVLELVSRADQRVVVANGGDGLMLRFDGTVLPPLKPGMTRDFFFHSIGWEKDGDHNVVDGDTVEPLPIGAADVTTTSLGATDWQVRYNTRWVSKRPWELGRTEREEASRGRRLD